MLRGGSSDKQEEYSLSHGLDLLLEKGKKRALLLIVAQSHVCLFQKFGRKIIKHNVQLCLDKVHLFCDQKPRFHRTTLPIVWLDGNEGEIGLMSRIEESDWVAFCLRSMLEMAFGRRKLLFEG